MGKPYFSELAALSKTYEWASQVDVNPFTKALQQIESLPLLVIGSGGSYTVAHFAATLHEYFTGRIAKPVTPLELQKGNVNLSKVALLFVTAGGRNPDIIAAFKWAIAHGSRRNLVLCSQEESPLGVLAQSSPITDSFFFAPPTGKDGFLATNSLLGFAAIFLRAYTNSLRSAGQLSCWDKLLGGLSSQNQFHEHLEQQCRLLWDRPVLTVLFGPATSSAAVDIESKFTEAAIGSVHIADYRNFAHGRHHWLAALGSQTSVLCFVSSEDEDVAEKTLALLPKQIPMARIRISVERPYSSLAALIYALHISGIAAKARGIDPGRPQVAPFGRKLYHLSVTSREQRNSAHVAIERKTAMPLDILARRGVFDQWMNAYSDFIQRLQAAEFHAIAFDYDDTICERRNRYNGITREIADCLCDLLQHGVRVGIATGRGRSVGSDLRKVIPREFWELILIGYYNGGFILPLSEELSDETRSAPSGELARFEEILQSDWRFSAGVKSSVRRRQISLEPINETCESLWDTISEMAQMNDLSTLSIVRSGHSVDVLDSGVSKLALCRELQKQVNSSDILCIGDRGKWPGNDFALLSSEFSLTSDEASTATQTCWNLAPPGVHFVQATLFYLKLIKCLPQSGIFRIRLSEKKNP